MGEWTRVRDELEGGGRYYLEGTAGGEHGD